MWYAGREELKGLIKVKRDICDRLELRWDQSINYRKNQSHYSLSRPYCDTNDLTF